MRLLLSTHPSALAHDTGANHPERPERISAVLAGIRRSGVAVIERQAPPVPLEVLTGVHSERYIESIRRFCESGGGYLDPDTHAVGASWDAALRSAGAGPAAVGDLRSGEGEAAYVVMRPPGHHALENKAMGFCLFNNVAVTARQLLDEGERVAIVDWDVHHGNGTQAMFDDEPDLLYLSLHEFPSYPGTGWVEEVGSGVASGTSVNIPFPTGSGSAAYLMAIHRLVRPILNQFDPTWVLVSSGYDAHARDPMAGIQLRTEDYFSLGAAVAESTEPGRLVLFLEGGYDLDALTGSSEATVRGIAASGESLPQPSEPPKGTAARILDFSAQVLGNYWELS
jgi:acetoin utilization deacetylase AcuC-like enzyme